MIENIYSIFNNMLVAIYLLCVALNRYVQNQNIGKYLKRFNTLNLIVKVCKYPYNLIISKILLINHIIMMKSYNKEL